MGPMFYFSVWTKYSGFIFDSPLYVCYSELDLSLIMATRSPEGSIVHIPIIRLKHLMKMGWKFARPPGSANPVINQRQGGCGGWEDGDGRGREKDEFNSAFLWFISVLLLLHLQDIMNSEKSYDSLPNFTAADCEFGFVFLLHPVQVTAVKFILYPCHKKSSDKEATWPLWCHLWFWDSKLKHSVVLHCAHLFPGTVTSWNK